jgi:hypothetical protein
MDYGHQRLYITASVLFGLIAVPLWVQPQQPRVPIAILTAVFDNSGAVASNPHVTAFCPASSSTAIQLDSQTPPIFSLAGNFGTVTCKLVYSAGGRTILTLNSIPVDGSQTTWVLAMMRPSPDPPKIIVQRDPVRFELPLISFTVPASMRLTGAAAVVAVDPDPKVTGSIDCGFWGPHEAQATCSARTQHPSCSCTSFLGWGKATCGCEAGGTLAAPSPPRNFPPPGHWQLVTFTSSNSALPDHGFITLTAPSGQQRQLQDIGASSVKLAQDVQFMCSTLNLNCPTDGWETVAIPFEAVLRVDATISVREVER